MLKRVSASMAIVGLFALIGCGGASTDKPTDGGSEKGIVYSAPSTTGSVPVVTLNNSLSTDTVVVFDVIGETPSQKVNGLSLILKVDPSKLQPTAVPGARDDEPRHLLSTPTATSGGFGGGYAIAVRSDSVDGTSTMGVAIRRPGPAVACSGTLLRFAYKVVGTPVQGVIRAQVLSGSGLTDGAGAFLDGTAPVIGRLEYK